MIPNRARRRHPSRKDVRGRSVRLSSESSEADMNERRDDPAHQRRRNVKPGIAEISCCDHWAERTRGIESAAGQSTTHDNVEAYRHADRERRQNARASGNRCAEDDGYKKKGKHGLDHETIRGQNRECRRAECKTMRETGPAETGGHTAEHEPQEQ